MHVNPKSEGQGVDGGRKGDRGQGKGGGVSGPAKMLCMGRRVEGSASSWNPCEGGLSILDCSKVKSRRRGTLENGFEEWQSESRRTATVLAAQFLSPIYFAPSSRLVPAMAINTSEVWEFGRTPWERFHCGSACATYVPPLSYPTYYLQPWRSYPPWNGQYSSSIGSLEILLLIHTSSESTPKMENPCSQPPRSERPWQPPMTAFQACICVCGKWIQILYRSVGSPFFDPTGRIL